MVAICKNRAFHPVGDFDRIIESVLPGFFPARSGHRGGVALNVWEEESSYFVEAEVPGLKLEELEVAIEGRELTLKGERGAAVNDAARYHRRERIGGAFERTLRLPEGIDSAKVQASLDHGVLTIELPKAEALRTRRIEVRTRG